MRIETVDLFYLALPEVRDIGDGSQDALLVRVRAGDQEGWGECEAAPLASIAAFVCPMSHSACHPVRDAVLGQTLESVDDIRRITAEVRRLCFDLLQADHTLSGIDIALWDLLGRRYEQPAYRLLGYERAYPKIAYASQLFGDTPEATYTRATEAQAAGFRAAKFGWGPYGAGSIAADAAQVEAARAGLGPDVALMVDAGTLWEEDIEAAAARLPALQAMEATWLEEPFANGALHAYRALADRSQVKLAGGEGAHNPYQAMHLIDYGGIGYVQIDAGRIGGITSAVRVARYAAERGVTYVNHTFTTPLALSASLQPYAGLEDHRLCEYPVASSPLASALTLESLAVDADGLVRVPDRPGLGLTPDPQIIRRYLQPVEIRVGDRLLYSTPEI
jgi:L-alanine-DL-glutamate epimerase-like enolase superfamily enzyme